MKNDMEPMGGTAGTKPSKLYIRTEMTNIRQAVRGGGYFLNVKVGGKQIRESLNTKIPAEAVRARDARIKELRGALDGQRNVPKITMPANESGDNPLIGCWFQAAGSGATEQGYVIGAVNSETFLVNVSPLQLEAKPFMKLAGLAQMEEWKFYLTEKDMRDARQGQGRRRYRRAQRQTREQAIP